MVGLKENKLKTGVYATPVLENILHFSLENQVILPWSLPMSCAAFPDPEPEGHLCSHGRAVQMTS